MADELSKLNIDEKWDIHNLVQQAIASAHSNPAPQTLKMFDKIDGRFDGMEEKIDKHIETFGTINTRLAIQEEISGKLTKILENTQEELSAIKDWKIGIVQSINTAVRIIAVVLVAIPTIASIIFTLYIKNLKTELRTDISQEVVTTLEEKYNLEIK